MMTTITRKIALAVLVIFGIIITLLLWILNSVRIQAWKAPIGRLGYTIDKDYQYLGLRPPTIMDDYYSSVGGSYFRCLKGKVMIDSHVSGGLLWAKNIHIRIEETDDTFLIKAKGDVIKPKWIFLRQLIPNQKCESPPIWKLPTGGTTKTLLTSVSAGTTEWKWWSTGSSGPLVIGAKRDPEPPISFDRPSDNAQLDEYKQWLVKMSGPWDRFCDDWNHEIKLTIEKRATTPLLVASSAGPDGKWNTKDDMVIKRDAKTGQIVEKIGFGVEK
jgi:hypothetical protein